MHDIVVPVGLSPQCHFHPSYVRLLSLMSLHALHSKCPCQWKSCKNRCHFKYEQTPYTSKPLKLPLFIKVIDITAGPIDSLPSCENIMCSTSTFPGGDSAGINVLPWRNWHCTVVCFLFRTQQVCLYVVSTDTVWVEPYLQNVHRLLIISQVSGLYDLHSVWNPLSWKCPWYKYSPELVACGCMSSINNFYY